ncbi:thermonuclease family protein [Aliarcobacter butzleri]|uniref:thermonuclease family protein n=1 Tax=Aliarcobacter butzleri TaxID=28197 RepID=UPI00263ED5B5|nr:thermonuclease family protein [Aliarcobacter butzleri]MDN5105047.1 thermonuclease family protein [Aliarcobacter butzleri]
MRFLLICLVFIINIYANEIKGKVIHISDGDTIYVLTPQREKYKIRLNDIDAPENKQAFGNKSKENLKKYIYNKNVSVLYNSKDKYGRILGTVYLNNQDINLQQLKDGFAWVYKKYSKNIIYYKAEKEA